MPLKIEKMLNIKITIPQICHFCDEPIIKLNGRDSESLCNHHITYIPDIKVPAHIGCHVKYHRTHPDHPINPETEYRKRFIETLDGDVICHFCGEEITKKFGRDSDSLNFHSLDNNHDNWDPGNKVPAHQKCHTSFHNRGRSYAYMMGDRSVMHRSDIAAIHAERMRRCNPMEDPEVPVKIWKTRRDRHGPSGHKGKYKRRKPTKSLEDVL